MLRRLFCNIGAYVIMEKEYKCMKCGYSWKSKDVYYQCPNCAYDTVGVGRYKPNLCSCIWFDSRYAMPCRRWMDELEPTVCSGFDTCEYYEFAYKSDKVEPCKWHVPENNGCYMTVVLGAKYQLSCTECSHNRHLCRYYAPQSFVLDRNNILPNLKENETMNSNSFKCRSCKDTFFKEEVFEGVVTFRSMNETAETSSSQLKSDEVAEATDICICRGCYDKFREAVEQFDFIWKVWKREDSK